MKITPVMNFKVNNLKKYNNKQVRFTPMASDSVSFGAKITDEMNKQAWRAILPKFLEKDEHDCQIYAQDFWKLDDRTIAAIMRTSDENTRKEFLRNSIIISYAQKKGKIEQLLQFTKTDSEVIDMLNTKIVTRDDYRGSRIEGPLKGAISFHDLIEALNKIKNTQKKKELLFSSWEQTSSINYPDKNPKITKETIASRLRLQDFSLKDRSEEPSFGPCGHKPKEFPSPEQMLKDMQKFYFILLEVIQDDSTTNKEAVKLIQEYKEFSGVAYGFYFEELEKIFTRQIVLTEE